ncbi:predicted protein [Chaetomium globosum CBS 148.51]|uniref:Large ribosomal subunit protein bL33m n=1 Tax=Chaetomium globosum (strain ATCC 6205 / CBS 148.51 / DSM 1962 / NBRC 6347 / NRRL 1970) TaxID=306901 RepID=Q2GS67_CHAGB|nr:uncharacterized protein CHGG_09187 [Chaetomium globosum CBS 148.51]EAQ85173.1 predicted protein [Chaetomium globosum CBS 148.51]
MAKKAKSRIINVRLLSMAMTGYFYTFTRARTALPMSMIKYDPISTNPPPEIHIPPLNTPPPNPQKNTVKDSSGMKER